MVSSSTRDGSHSPLITSLRRPYRREYTGCYIINFLPITGRRAWLEIGPTISTFATDFDLWRGSLLGRSKRVLFAVTCSIHSGYREVKESPVQAHSSNFTTLTVQRAARMAALDPWWTRFGDGGQIKAVPRITPSVI